MPKRLWHVLLPLALTATMLTGCGISSANTGSLSPLCPDTEPAKDAVTIEWWLPWANPTLTRAAQEFNCENPKILVKITLYPDVGDDRQGKLLAATVGRSQPNVIISYDDVIARWASQGMIQPMDDAIAGAGIKADDFVPEAWDSAQWQGHTYGVPIDWDPDNLLWYNKKVFVEAGLDPNRPPATWAEFEEYARRIDQVENGTIKRLGFVPWSGWEFNDIALGHLFDAGLESGSERRVALNTPGMRKALEWEASIARKFGGAAKINSFTSIANATGAAADPLISGRVGMMMVGDWYLGNRQIVGAKRFEETVGVGLMPPPPGGRPYLCHSGWSFMMPRGAGNVKETMAFVTWMLDDSRFTKHFGAALGWAPAKLSTRSTPFYAKDKMWQAILTANAKAGPERQWLPPSPVLAEYYRALGDAEEQVINLKMTPAQALAEADSIVQQALQVAITERNYG
ncbi:extracellular solute-binding protein [Actinopolymorpha pittospori]|uniref:Multiple sugar transport system substrate-binding protein n=1 Tax=Actinopolymorpha pittospori TaxID=648752 RepID=A0A927N3E2_9ACTN|nr:multiple sugar transport system substrate-binding protein [Actinopolymorpha pittospori]